MSKGRFITFEGGEGSGKSTQARLLAERLASLAAIDAVVTREPGGTPFAERLRAILLEAATGSRAPLAEALVFYAARADHLDAVIRPALDAGRWVVSDRFSDSTRVYQGHAGSLDHRMIDALELLVTQNTTPDLTVIIDVPADVGLARAAVRRRAEPSAAATQQRAVKEGVQRGIEGLVPDRFEGRDIAFHRKLRDGFLAIAAKEPARCIVVDGQLTPDEVAERVWAAVIARLQPALV